jgi:hypothetical protein
MVLRPVQWWYVVDRCPWMTEELTGELATQRYGALDLTAGREKWRG